MGCVSGGQLPGMVAPQDSTAFDEGTILGVGIQVLDESTVAIGESRSLLRPHHRLAFFDLVQLGIRQNFSERCEYLAAIRIGATSGGIRCAFEEEAWIAGFKSQFEWEWFGGASMYNGLQVGAYHDGWVFLLDTGLRTGWDRGFASTEDAKFGGNPSLLSELLFGPTSPYVKVSRGEIGWRNGITLGASVDRHMTIFFSPYVELPLWTGWESYSCVGCSLEVGDFQPDFKFGLTLGIGVY